MTAPIQAQHRDLMNALAQTIDEIFNPPHAPKRVAFTLFIAEFGQMEGGRVNYISNGDRADMVAMVREWLARVDGATSGSKAGRA